MTFETPTLRLLEALLDSGPERHHRAQPALCPSQRRTGRAVMPTRTRLPSSHPRTQADIAALSLLVLRLRGVFGFFGFQNAGSDARTSFGT
jgi:hypothetical protein